ncbi:ribonuclease P protein component [Candidatus Parcubacteria bacterium]|nr:MAG: ribonuclease P protein component [Candidatus Parcubacteria bacterium]
MFKKTARLRKKKDIEAVFKSKISKYNKFFGLKAKENNLNYSRFTVVVGTKVSKKAVVRNRIKRRVRSVLKEEYKSLERNVDLLILALNQAENIDMKETRNSVKNLLKTAKLLK